MISHVTIHFEQYHLKGQFFVVSPGGEPPDLNEFRILEGIRYEGTTTQLPCHMAERVPFEQRVYLCLA